MNKSFWAILGVAILALVGIFIFSGGKASDTSSGAFAYTEPLLNPQAHDYSVGQGTKATIVEYADFQCPYCAAYSPLMDQVKQTFGDEVKVIFRNFPLATHAQSMAAHRAAGAAANQGKFWEMHNVLFQNQDSWSGNTSAAAIFETYAEQLGLNMDQYKTDVASDLVYEKINSDIDSGRTLGVSATPTLYYNGTKLENPPTTIEEWTALIEKGEMPQPKQQQ